MQERALLLVLLANIFNPGSVQTQPGFLMHFSNIIIVADYIEFTIQTTDEALRERLIALLSHAGATGFEEEKRVLRAFVPAAAGGLPQIQKIIAENGLSFSTSTIPEKNWNAEWEAGFSPVTIGNFCTIRADFHQPDDTVQHDIVITPKMSFGTGHHATTHLMIEAMEQLDFAEKKVFDFGTGTGILSILAEKCGAASITAIDNDNWSINNATENFNLNDCSKILLSNCEGFMDDALYDVILANINRNVILGSLTQIQQHLNKSGVVLFSGLLTGDEAIITSQASLQHLVLRKKSTMNGWICLLMVNE